MQVRATRAVTVERGRFALQSVLVIVVGAILGCAGPSASRRDDGMLLGGVLGAGTGAVVGNQFGSPATGTIIGGVGGATMGSIVGSAQDRSEARRAQQRRVLERQAVELKRQQDEMSSLRRQEYYDRKYLETVRRMGLED